MIMFLHTKHLRNKVLLFSYSLEFVLLILWLTGLGPHQSQTCLKVQPSSRSIQKLSIFHHLYFRKIYISLRKFAEIVTIRKCYVSFQIAATVACQASWLLCAQRSAVLCAQIVVCTAQRSFNSTMIPNMFEICLFSSLSLNTWNNTLTLLRSLK